MSTQLAPEIDARLRALAAATAATDDWHTGVANLRTVISLGATIDEQLRLNARYRTHLLRALGRGKETMELTQLADVRINHEQQTAFARFMDTASPTAFRIWIEPSQHADGALQVNDSSDADPRPCSDWVAAVAQFKRELATYVTDDWDVG